MIPHVYISRLSKAALLLSLVALLYPSSASCQSSKSESYVVIGAFAIEKNATRLISYAKQKGIKAEYQIHPSKDLYYVYEQVDDPFKERRRIKEIFPEFYDVWVYEGLLGRDGSQSNLADTKEELVSGSMSVSNTVSEASAGILSDEEVVENETSNGSTSEEMAQISTDKSTVTVNEETSEETPTNLEKKEGSYYLYLNTVNSKNLKEVKGKVNVIDPVRAKQLREAKSHEIVEVRDPKNGSKEVKLATQIFGFREVQQTINLENPVNDSTSSYVHTIGDSIIVDFELQRYKKGDLVIMYNVYFFKDAAIMKPESIYELNSLLDMLRENDNLVVQLHGHTNGNSHGKILHLDLEDKNFFSLNATHKEDVGSAKKLSEYRAYTIQHWLMEQGIAEERIEIKGWGGKKMIYDKHDTQAFKNVRVEVEILED